MITYEEMERMNAEVDEHLAESLLALKSGGISLHLDALVDGKLSLFVADWATGHTIELPRAEAVALRDAINTWLEGDGG